MKKIYNSDDTQTPNPAEPQTPQEDNGPLTTPWGVGKEI